MVANNYTGGSHRVVDKPKEEDGEMYLVHFSWPTLQIIVLIKLLYVLYNFITIIDLTLYFLSFVIMSYYDNPLKCNS